MNPEILSLLAAVGVTVVSPFVALLIALSLNVIEGALGLESSISLGRLFGVVVLGAAMAVTLFRRPRRGGARARRGVVLSIVLFVVVCAVGVAVSTDLKRGGMALMRLVALAGVPFLLLTFVTSRRRLRILVWTLAAAYSAAAGLAILQYRAMRSGGVGAAQEYGEVSGRGEEARYSGAQGKPNALAAVITTGVPFLIIAGVQARSVWSRLMWTGVLCIAGGGLLLAASRTYLIVSGVLLAAFLVLTGRHRGLVTKRVVAWSGIVAVVAILVIGGLGDALPRLGLDRLTGTDLGTDSSAGYRFQTIEVVWVALAASPLVGVGLANFKYYNPVFGMDPHDSFTALVGETGLAGTIVFIAVVGNVLVLAFRTRRAAIAGGDDEIRTIVDATLASTLAALLGSFGFILHWQRLWWLAIGLLFVLSAYTARRRMPDVGIERMTDRRVDGRPIPSGLAARARSRLSAGREKSGDLPFGRGESGRAANMELPRDASRRAPSEKRGAEANAEGTIRGRTAGSPPGALGEPW